MPKASNTAKTPMTAEQAAQRIAELEAQLAAKDAAVASPEQTERIASMEAALLAAKTREVNARRLAEMANDEDVFEVRSLIAAALSVMVSDAKGNQKLIQFEKQGSTQFLTASQVAEVSTGTDFFARGFLEAPGMVTPNPNAIADFDTFLNSLEPDSISARIAQIDSPDVLYGLSGHIEAMRWAAEDNKLVRVPIGAKETMVLHAVLDRLREMTEFNVSASDPE